jgi:2-keto-4-pentenoate hydratase/2-oxohepta-3-ene-1,7-dioic acid hydratase in catechol pathway
VDGVETRLLPPGETLLGLLGDDGERMAAAGERARHDPAEVVSSEDAMLLAPIPHPPSIRDFYAFEEHVATARRARGLEMDPDWYELPVFYFSNPHRVVATGEDVAIPRRSSAMDFELEVAAIVGRDGSDLSPEEAESHIAGLTVMNDWSARDLQRREMQLGLGPAKGKDFATTLGPHLLTPDELEDRTSGGAYDLVMTAGIRRGGSDRSDEVSRGNLADLHWTFAEMIAYASRDARVAAGDIIGSGTVGTGCLLELSLVHGEEAHPWLQPGDEVTLEVERLGAITNRVVA